MSGRLEAVSLWFQRLWWAQHNARVIINFEDRMEAVIEAATDGGLTKAYYTKEAMLAEIAAAGRQAVRDAYEEGRKDALTEHGITTPGAPS